MYIIPETPNPSGAYPPPQTWDSANIPEGYAAIPDGFDMDLFFGHNGFVALTVEDGTVAKMKANTSAWEKWIQENPPILDPEPEPTADEDRDAMLVDLEYRLALLELGL